ncbi:MAG: hypothetical protein ACI30R_01790 [Sodaliphilus sp.]
MMKHISIHPSASTFYHNEEAAAAGEALTAENLRGRCQSVEATGMPQKVGAVSAGHRLICLFEGTYITENDGSLYADGNAFHHTSAKIVEAYTVDPFLVVNTTGGLLIFRHRNGAFTLLQQSDAVPELHLSTIEVGTVGTDIDAYTFASPLSAWRAPLPAEDVKNLTSAIANACRQIAKTAEENGEYISPLLARYALRMTNDQYLWMSAPVLIGHHCVSGNYRCQSEAVTSGSSFSGIAATTFALPSFKLGVSVVKGIAEEWRDLIKSVDILITEPAEQMLTSALDYRIATTSVGSKKYIAEFGPQPRSTTAIMNELMEGKWHVAASCTHLAELSNHQFASWDSTRLSTAVLPGIPAFALGQTAFSQSLTHEQCKSIVEQCGAKALPERIIAQGGRLFVGSNRSRVVAPWQPSILFEAPFTATPCTVRTIERIAGTEGEITLCATHSYDFTPSALNPLLCTAHPGATSLCIEITSLGTTTVVERPLTPLPHAGIAATFESEMQSITPASGTPQSVDSFGTVVSTPGRLIVSHIGDPLTTFSSQTVTGAHITALVATERPIYSGGFGRHPLYVFTRQGIYVVPQATNGSFGEAKLMSRKILAEGTTPVAGGGKIWFNSAHRRLCTIEGSAIKMMKGTFQCSAMAWNDAEEELWLMLPDGTLSIVRPDGFRSTLTISALHLYANGTDTLLITPEGNVHNICESTPCQQHITYLSHPIVVNTRLRERIVKIVWNIFGSNLHLRATLWGETGARPQRFSICAITLNGDADAPIVLPVMARPCHAIRIMIEGTAPSGTIIRSTEIGIDKG